VIGKNIFLIDGVVILARFISTAEHKSLKESHLPQGEQRRTKELAIRLGVVAVAMVVRGKQ